MRSCPNCGATNREDAEFCALCLSDLEAHVYDGTDIVDPDLEHKTAIRELASKLRSEKD